ncbi:hypothetical protein [Rhodococcus opacus]|nr:hypothetical protein [Rhodococcus opacus]UDH01227.1 hypothetical protein K2Z90_007691 [Rhodococcus opacus PD630]
MVVSGGLATTGARKYVEAEVAGFDPFVELLGQDEADEPIKAVQSGRPIRISARAFVMRFGRVQL